MALLETWEQSYAAPQTSSVRQEELMLDSLLAQAAAGKEGAEAEAAPMFELSRINYRPPAQIRLMVVCNKIVIMALENSHLLRLDETNPSKVEEISEISKKSPGQTISHLFQDPTGRHVLISMENGENWYLHRDQLKPRAVSKLKGMVICSVAWDKRNQDPSTTSRILLGTNNGRILEAQIRGRDASHSLVYSMSDRAPVTGLHYQRFPSDVNKFVVFATTPTRIYQFIGGPSFEAVFPSNDVNPGFHELPGDLNYSVLHMYSKFSGGISQSFGWLTSPGVFYGDIIFGSQNPGDTLFQDTKLFPYPASSPDPDNQFRMPEPPIDFVITDFHFLLLYKEKFQAICRLDERVVQEVPLHSMSRKSGRMLGIMQDPNTRKVWLFAQGCIYEVDIEDESREVWRLYLDMGQFELALKYCKTEWQEDRVHTAQAKHHFERGKYQLAATFFGKANTSFEEVTLKFVRVGEMAALKTYLVHKVDSIPEKDRTQRILICTWLVQLYLSTLNDLEAGHASKEQYRLQTDEFKQFLIDYRTNLDSKTVLELISSNGRMDMILFFANVVKDYELMINQYIQLQSTVVEREGGNVLERYMEATYFYRRVVDVLSKSYQSEADGPVQSLNLVYQYSPILIEHVPCELVAAWIKFTKLNPKRLLPALTRYQPEHNRPDVEENQAIVYLEHCVKELGNREPAVHNALLALYVKQRDEEPLTKFISARDRYFDPQYALRQCLKGNKAHACVFIYGSMGLYEEAVSLALQVDIELATLNADKLEDDPALRKKLWLRIARHVVEEQRDIRKAMEFLHKCDFLKIEDILPFFPDFFKIDEFKAEICAALKEYNLHIENLKKEMEAAEVSAGLIRRDIGTLRQKYGMVGDVQECDQCRQPLTTQAFFLFPCQHVFHTDCYTREVQRHLSPVVKQQLEMLKGRLRDELRQEEIQRTKSTEKELESSLSTFAQTISNVLDRNDDAPEETHDENSTSDSIDVSTIEQLKDEIDRLLADECFLCGDIMIDSIDIPLIGEDEGDEMKSWALE